MTTTYARAVPPLLALLAACVPPPTPPTTTVVNDSSVPSSVDAIRYRILAPSDFRAAQPPAHAERHAAFGALSCVRLVPQAPQHIEAQRTTQGTRRAAMPRAIFYAEMDRACSWWNDEIPKTRIGYVLQHEQIHFALVELHARQLTAVVRALELDGPTPDSAAALLRHRVAWLADSTVAEVVRDNDVFDAQTAARIDPRTQYNWFLRVTRALRRLPAPTDPAVPDP
jgi:hypothetical protein